MSESELLIEKGGYKRPIKNPSKNENRFRISNFSIQLLVPHRLKYSDAIGAVLNRQIKPKHWNQ